MKITIANNVATATTSITKEAYDKVLKWKPELLEIKDADKKTVFKVGVTTGNGSATRYGACFTVGVNGKLGITIPLADGVSIGEATLLLLGIWQQ